MNNVYSITTAKANLSTIINEVEHNHKKVLITKKGKNVAVILPFNEYIEQNKDVHRDGLILAKGALADLEDLDNFLNDIYTARGKSFERKVKM